MTMLQLIMTSDYVPVTLPEVVIVPTIPVHLQELRETMREKDRQEMQSYGFTCARGLWRSYKNGLNNRTATIDGAVAAVWGCGGVYMGDVGRPWLLTSEIVEKISPLRFARIYQKEVHEMLSLFPRLENYVDSKYDEAIRLLSIVGFTIGEPEPWGKGVFRKFSMERRT